MHKHILSRRNDDWEMEVALAFPTSNGGHKITWDLDYTACVWFANLAYGLPMRPAGGFKAEDFPILGRLYTFCATYSDFEGMDATADEMRIILQEPMCNQLEKSISNMLACVDVEQYDWKKPFQMLVEHLVYGDLSKRDNKIDIWLNCVEEMELLQWFGKEFARKAMREARCRPELGGVPDLEEACRYHQHTEHGLPCYRER